MNKETADIKEAPQDDDLARETRPSDSSQSGLKENDRPEHSGSGGRRWDTLVDGINRRPCTWLALFGLLLAMQISPWWYATADGSAYLSIARSAASGETLTCLGSHQLYYFPGYPLTISPAFLAGDRPFLLLSVIQWLLGLIFLVGVYRWARRTVPTSAVLITGLCTINAALWIYYRRTLSEMAFMAVLIWTVNVLNSIDLGSPKRRTCWQTVLAAAGTVLVALIRPAGIMLAAGFGIAMILAAFKTRADWLLAITLTLCVGLPASAVVVATIKYDRAMASLDEGRGFTYLDDLTDPTVSFGSQILEGIRLRVSDVGRLAIPGMFKTYADPGEWFNVNMAIYLALSAMVAFGWWRFARHGHDVLALTLPFYLVLHVVWPFDQSVRFLVPMLPLVIVCLWFAAAIPPSRRTGLFGFLLLAHFAAAAGYWAFVDAPRTRGRFHQWPTIDRLAELIETEPGQVAASGLSEEIWSMLQFALNRPVPIMGIDGPISPDVHWVLTPSTAKEPNEFSTRHTAGGYRLSTRR